MGVYSYDGTNLTNVAGSSVNESLLAPVESSTTSSAKYEIGEKFILYHTMYEATAVINIGGTIVPPGGSGTANCKVADSLAEQVEGKQDVLTQGTNITISGNTISATDTTYESKAAAQGGTDVSLVTTGDKYNWNNKPDTTTVYAVADTAETALADADYVPFYDTSATAKRKTLWSNIKSVLKTFFDTVYSPKATIKTATLTAGQTSVTFTQIPTTGNYLFQLFTTSGTLEFNDVDDSVSGSLTYTFDEQESDVSVKLKIEEV